MLVKGNLRRRKMKKLAGLWTTEIKYVSGDILKGVIKKYNTDNGFEYELTTIDGEREFKRTYPTLKKAKDVLYSNRLKLKWKRHKI
jgi:hypothetical protein